MGKVLLLVYSLLVSRIASLYFTDLRMLVSLNYGNDSAFTLIQEDKYKPGVLIAFLSHAIVRINLRDPQDMELLAGVPDMPGYSDDTGTGIRFNHPWDLVQLSRSRWIISDNGNNCLRNFNVGKDTENSSRSIIAWSNSCDSSHTSSTIGHLIGDSTFYSPRGLAHAPRRKKIFVTYERPYSLAEIYMRNDRVIVKYSSPDTRLRRIFPFGSEIILTTDPYSLFLRYTGSSLEQGINEDWDALYSVVDNVPYTSGFTYLHQNYYVQSISSSNTLLVINTEYDEITEICNIVATDLDDNLGQCNLASPQYVAHIDGVLYVGESGRFGGGIKSMKAVLETEEESHHGHAHHIHHDHDHDEHDDDDDDDDDDMEEVEKESGGLSDTQLGIICASVGVLIIITIVVGVVIYRKQRYYHTPATPNTSDNTAELRPLPHPSRSSTSTEYVELEHPASQNVTLPEHATLAPEMKQRPVEEGYQQVKVPGGGTHTYLDVIFSKSSSGDSDAKISDEYSYAPQHDVEDVYQELEDFSGY